MMKVGFAIIMMGIPGSGKSTFVRSYCSFARWINLDTLHTRARERAELAACLERCTSFVIDNTNPRAVDRAPYIKAAKEAGYDQVVGIYMQSSVSACIARNAQREGKARVPDHVIAHISRMMELPKYSEGFDCLLYVRMENNEFIIEEWRDENEV